MAKEYRAPGAYPTVDGLTEENVDLKRTLVRVVRTSYLPGPQGRLAAGCLRAGGPGHTGPTDTATGSGKHLAPPACRQKVVVKLRRNVMIETKKSFCRFCHALCGIEVDVEGS